MEREHPDGETPFGEPSLSTTQKSYTGKGKGRAKTPPPVEEGGSRASPPPRRFGEGSSFLLELHRPDPRPDPSTDTKPTRKKRVLPDFILERQRGPKMGRIFRSMVRQARFSALRALPPALIAHILKMLPFSKFLMMRCTCKVIYNALSMDEDGSGRELLWEVGFACLKVSMPKEMLFDYLTIVLSRGCPSNTDRVYIIEEAYHCFFGDRLEHIIPENGEHGVVKFTDLFPKKENVLPSALCTWLYSCANGIANTRGPSNCVATLQAAGFFSTYRTRKRLIAALRNERKVMDKKHIHIVYLLKLFDFLIDLTKESYHFSKFRVGSKTWLDGFKARSWQGEKYSMTTFVVCVRREDVVRLNAKHGLNIRYDFPGPPQF